jgi:hypothetical protein
MIEPQQEGTMREIDEIRIEGEEDGFHLVIYSEEPLPIGQVGTTMVTHRFRIGLPDQFKAEVDRTIGAWLAEGERARQSMPDDRFAEARALGTALGIAANILSGGTPGDGPDYDLARDLERGK